MTIQQKLGGGNFSQSQQNFLVLALSLASVPSSKNRYDQKDRAPNSKSQEVFQAPGLTPLSLSVVGTIRVSFSHENKDVSGVVSLVTS